MKEKNRQECFIQIPILVVIIISFVVVFISSSKLIIYAQEQSIADIVEGAIPSVVQIVVYDITGAKRGEGSGFFIGPDKILTNAHVIENGYSAEVFSESEYYDRVTILKSDSNIDLAVIKVDERNEAYLPLEQKQEIRPGERILAIGNPLGLEKTVSDGLVSAIRGVPGGLQIIQISAPISPGSSGGPLLNQQGRVIGVTTAMLSEGQNLNFAVGIRTITNFLDEPDNPRQLHEAKARILWRVILKWVANIIVWLIALAFGGGWWIVIIVILIFTLIGWVCKNLYRWVAALFRRSESKK